MELSQEDKDRIREEEKLRMDTRREYLNQSCCHGGGCHRCGRGIFKVLGLIAAIALVGHFWCHGHGGWNRCAYDERTQPAPAAPQAPLK
jgi:hypothetical protein